MKSIHFKNLPTEKENPSSRFLDSLSIEEIVLLINREDRKIPDAVKKEKKRIVMTIKLIVRSLRSGGRIFFVGAGTSGRLGVMESAELPPTFNSSPQLVQAIMAGGKRAVFRSQEGAEDNEIQVKNEIKNRVRAGDVIIGIAASGVTPFVQSALTQAKKMSAKTILVTCNLRSPVGKIVDVLIAPKVGPEIIAGSTRLKSATATKMILNMLTTISMVQLGKVYGNRMVDLQPKSQKLRERGIGLVCKIAQVSRKEAIETLHKAHWKVKIAILMAKKNLSYQEAVRRLSQHKGFLRRVIG